MNQTAAEMVCLIRDRLAERIGPSRFRTWFGDVAQFELNGEQLDVYVETDFASQWISNNFTAQMTEVAREVVGPDAQVGVRFRGNGRGANAAEGGASAAAPPTPARRRRVESARLRGDLDTFVVGASNELAYAAARTVARAPRAAARPLVMHGGCGLGKTHLLQGICNAARAAHPALEWRYVSGEEFTNEFITAVKHGRIDLFRARFRSVDLLVIDDIHFLANKRATQEEFLHTFNAIDAAGRTVVLSSDRDPREIATLSDALINRLIAGMVVQIHQPDSATRLEILRRRAAQMRCEIPRAVLEYVAAGVTRNVRELEGAIYKLAALAALMKAPITVELAREAIGEYLTRRPPAVPWAEIERIVAAHFGVSREMIRSRSRDRTVSLARASAMFLIRKHTPMSLPEIGRALGGKNHSTVLMAIQRIEAALSQNSAVAWKTPAGGHSVPIRELLATLEQLVGAA